MTILNEVLKMQRVNIYWNNIYFGGNFAIKIFMRIYGKNGRLNTMLVKSPYYALTLDMLASHRSLTRAPLLPCLLCQAYNVKLNLYTQTVYKDKFFLCEL
jgi:hypothetical protein